MTEMNEKKLNRIKALAIDWRRNPKFKEICRSTWDPIFFNWCEEAIKKLEEVENIEKTHSQYQDYKSLDISEIVVEGW